MNPIFTITSLLLACALLTGCANTPAPSTPDNSFDQTPTLTAAPADPASQNVNSASLIPIALREGVVYEDWGIEVKAIIYSASGYMLDFRFKVLDAQKAASLFGKEVDPHIIDEATGAKFIVPSPPKVGKLRQTLAQSQEGKIYFILFANPGRYIKPGNKVTVVIGDFQAQHLIVEG